MGIGEGMIEFALAITACGGLLGAWTIMLSQRIDRVEDEERQLYLELARVLSARLLHSEREQSFAAFERHRLLAEEIQ